ncbi:MAG: TRAP transporter TatT component family protein [Planctomycetota bacterium]|nr:TRAP transporter TatT component family protein [Planctomycetota bacterium]
MRAGLFPILIAAIAASSFVLQSTPRANADPKPQDRKVRDKLHGALAQQARSYLQQNLSVKQAKKLGDGLERSIDRLSKRDPDSQPLAFLYCEVAVAFSFAFKEDEDTSKARELYVKAQQKARYFLKKRYPKNYKALTAGTADAAKKAIKTLKRRDLPAVFWYAFALGMETNLIRSTQLLIQLPRQRLLMEWVLARDETIFNAGPHLSLALSYSAFPKAAGGNLKRALTHFSAIEKITGRRWLLARIIRAKYFSVALQNELPDKATAKDRQAAAVFAWQDFFMQLESVAKAPDKLWPSRNLYNSVAKEKAWDMLRRADDYIFPPKGYSNPYEESD